MKKLLTIFANAFEDLSIKLNDIANEYAEKAAEQPTTAETVADVETAADVETTAAEVIPEVIPTEEAVTEEKTETSVDDFNTRLAEAVRLLKVLNGGKK